MITVISQAVKNFSTHQLSATCKDNSDTSQMRTVVAYIDINVVESQCYRVWVAYSYVLLQQIAQIYLAEDESDDETLQEMALETTNMLIGSAKTLASESSTPFDIKTPHLSENKNLELGEANSLNLLINDEPLQVLIEEQNNE